jgi:hypothetical protein
MYKVDIHIYTEKIEADVMKVVKSSESIIRISDFNECAPK